MRSPHGKETAIKELKHIERDEQVQDAKRMKVGSKYFIMKDFQF